MSRAERRRMERAVGKHRAASKKGHRSSVRVPEVSPEQGFSALEAAGFQIAQPRIIRPGEEDGRHKKSQ